MTVQNPLDRTMQFAQGLSGLQNQAQARAGEEQRQGILQQEQQQVMQSRIAGAEANKAMQDLLGQYAESGDPAVMRQIIMTNPDVAQKIQQQLGVADEASAKSALNEGATFKRMLETDPAAATEYYQANLAGSPTWAGLADNLAAGDVAGAINEIGYAATALGGETAYEQVFGGGVIDMENQPSAVQEFEFYKNLSPEDQKKYINVKRSGQFFKAGDVTMGLDPLGTGQATPVVEPGTEPTTQPEAQKMLTKQEALKSATISAADQAIAMSKEAFDQILPIRTSLGNIDEAIRLVEQEGANTGAVASRFPSITSSAVALDNVQRKMGLDVISSVTFGALSAGELNLALQTAIPLGLGEKELITWLKDRKKSQTKLADYLSDAAIYLGTPGNTVAGFLAQGKSKPTSRNEPEAPETTKEPIAWGDM